MTDNRPNNNWRGWQELYDEYTAKLEAACAKVTYAKQKYGYLCFEVDCKNAANTDEIYTIIDEVEEKSRCICEICGSQENVGEADTGGWIKTLCTSCDDELSKNDLYHIRLGEQELATGTHGNWANIKRD